MTGLEIWITVGMMVLGTVIVRFLAFVLFPDHRETSPYIIYLGRVLPYAVIGFLVVYCLKSVSFLKAPHGIPELIAIVCVVLLHLWRKNILISIGLGTVIYMILIQRIFLL